MSDDSKNKSAAPTEVPVQVVPMAMPKSNLLTRLFGKKLTGNELNIAIAPFVDAAGQDHARELAAVFQDIDGIQAKAFKETPVLGPESDRVELLPAACVQAMNWVGSMSADLVLWGDIPPPGTTFFIHFAAAPPQDKDPAGITSPYQSLNLPLGFDPKELGSLLVATSLAAMNLTIDGKIKTCQKLIASALEHAISEIENIPSDFTMREKASVQAAFANALAAFGHLFPGGEVFQRASKAYVEAIRGTLRSEAPTNWAYLQRNLGAVLQALSERNDDIDTMELAVAAYRESLDVFTREATPFPWATTQNRLGEMLYRLDIKSGDTDGIKEGLTCFQGALKILTLKSTPLLWSDTLNNLGQAAQVLGREIDNLEVIERSVTACQQALKVRTIDKYPTLWAATQNNMGSALFLQGRMTGTEKHFEQALEAFMGAREVYETLGLTRMVKLTEKNIQHAQSRLPDKNDKTSKGGDSGAWWMEEDES